eukprot:1158982-Pelagomonas_calceolata.AAC.2
MGRESGCVQKKKQIPAAAHSRPLPRDKEPMESFAELSTILERKAPSRMQFLATHRTMSTSTMHTFVRAPSPQRTSTRVRRLAAAAQSNASTWADS